MLTYDEYLKKMGFKLNTREAYIKDKILFEEFLASVDLNNAEKSDVIRYIIDLQNKDYSEASIARKLAALKKYYYYALNVGLVEKDPTFEIETLKVKKQDREDIVPEDVIEDFINLSLEKDTFKSRRDFVLFMLTYETGINTIDLLEKKIDSIDLGLGYFVYDKSYIYLEENTLSIVEEYIKDLKSKYPENDYLLVNMRGKKLSRQGVWKIFKTYSQKLNIDRDITAQTLINNHMYYKRRKL